MNLKEQIDLLRQEINYHSNLYYNHDAPEISDAQFDELMNQLKELERQHPELVTEDSPTQRVGGRPVTGTAIQHVVPMLSLRDVFDQTDVGAFISDIQVAQSAPTPVFSVEPKIDGLSVSLEYQDGRFVRGATRGDGAVGEDVTAAIKAIPSIPQKLKHDVPGQLILRGEVYMAYDAFERANEQQELLGKKAFANPRNAAAGTLRMLDVSIIKQRQLELFVFNVQAGLEQLTSHIETLDFCEGLGLPVVPRTACKTEDEVFAAIAQIAAQRGGLPYGIDGAVVKLDDRPTRKQMGNTTKTPRWAVAYKYPPERKETKVLNIDCQVGRTGRITPVAILESVAVAGTTVARATLHNQDYIKARDIRVGDAVIIQKAGDIIPEVVEVVMEKRPADTVPFLMPDTCPVCGGAAEYEEGGADLRCQNLTCPAQKLRRLLFFASKPCMDIDGLGPNTLEELYGSGYVTSIEDFYHLSEHREELINSGIIGKQKSVDNLLAAIERSKEAPLPRLIKALGVRHVGAHVGKALAEAYHSMDGIMALDSSRRDELLMLPGIGGVIADAVLRFVAETQDTVNHLAGLGMNMIYSNQSAGNELAGKIFVLTGTLPNMGRAEATQLIESHGGKVSGSVSKKTSYVVAGEEAGSKLQKAHDLGIPILTEAQLKEMCNE